MLQRQEIADKIGFSQSRTAEITGNMKFHILNKLMYACASFLIHASDVFGRVLCHEVYWWLLVAIFAVLDIYSYACSGRQTLSAGLLCTLQLRANQHHGLLGKSWSMLLARPKSRKEDALNPLFFLVSNARTSRIRYAVA